MSVHVSSWVWKHSQAAGNELLVLLALADIADDEGKCWPSQGFVAGRTRLSVSTVGRALRSLAESGELAVAGSVSGRQNVYRITQDLGQIDLGQIDVGLGLDKNHLGQLLPSTSVSSDRAPRSTVTDNTSLKRHNTSEGAAKRGSRIPGAFAVDDLMRQWAKSKVPAVDVDTETENFVDYWRAKAGKDAVKLDWKATWQTWMRRAQGYRERDGWKPTQGLSVPDGQEWMLR